MDYTQNELKVYSNKCIEIEQETYLNSLLEQRDELVGLLDLFLEGGNHREKTLHFRKNGIEEIFHPKIKEAKRVLCNTRKRLSYNFERIM